MKLFVFFIVSIILIGVALSFAPVPTENKQKAFIEITKVRLNTVHDNQNQIATMLLSISDRLDNIAKQHRKLNETN